MRLRPREAGCAGRGSPAVIAVGVLIGADGEAVVNEEAADGAELLTERASSTDTASLSKLGRIVRFLRLFI